MYFFSDAVGWRLYVKMALAVLAISLSKSLYRYTTLTYDYIIEKCQKLREVKEEAQNPTKRDKKRKGL